MDDPDAARNVNPRMLVVDDEPNIRELLTVGLRFKGFAVRAVSSGAAALDEAARSAPHIVVLDVGLPDMHGFTVARMVRCGCGRSSGAPNRPGHATTACCASRT